MHAILGFVLAAIGGAAIGLWLTRGHALKDRLMIAGLLGTMGPIWLEAAKLALKGEL